ncbi:MAG: peptidylprolyl isomerase, partial [Planctomycetaceae bacterium]
PEPLDGPMRCRDTFTMRQPLPFAVIVALFVGSGVAVAEPKAESATKAETAKQGTSDATTVLVVVDDQPITQGDLDFFMLIRSVPEEQRAKLRKRYLEQLVDRRVMRAYLTGRKVEADKLELDAQVGRIRRMIAKTGDEPDKVLARLGLSEKAIRAELSLNLMWQAYLGRVVTPESVREYFGKHRRELDGTEIRASQIFLHIEAPRGIEQIERAREKLKQIRAELVANKMTFAEAARKYSESPTREKGGDLGFFPYRGKMPTAFTQVVFQLKLGEMSEPFITPFGAHLAKVIELKAGAASLSLEDVRPAVLSRMSSELWNETLAAERAKANIRWMVDNTETPKP